MDRRIWIISLILFINVLGSGLILPLLPFFAQNLGAGPLVIGRFISTLPFFAILSGPPLGVLSDKYGRRPVLLFSLAGTVIGFILLGLAKTLPLLFLARAIDGISAGNMSTAKAAIADITTQEERVSKLGLTFAAESLGLILGPVIGGLFSQYGFTVAAYIAAGIAMLCLVLTVFFFPETRPPAAAVTPAKSLSTLKLDAFFNFDELFSAARSPRTRPLVSTVFIIQLLIMMMWGTLALFGQHFFGFGGVQMGYISAFAAGAGIFSQTVLLKPITRGLGDTTTIISALLLMSGGLALLALSGAVGVLLVGVGLMASCFNIAMPTVVGLASRRSTENEQGSLMGTVSSAINIASLVGPVLGNAVYSISIRGNYFFASAIGLAAFVLVAGGLRKEAARDGIGRGDESIT